MRRRMPIAAAALAVSAVMLTACTAGNTPGGSGEDTELTFFTFETPNLTPEYWDKAIANASAEVPGVTIKRIVGENNADYLQKLWTSGQAPDIIVGGPADMTSFPEKGWLAEWDESEIGDLVVPDGFAGEVDGKIYALPQPGAQTIPLVYYNKDMFEKAGITEAPTSWDEFLEVSEQLKAAGITPIEIGGGGEDTWAAEMTPAAIIASDLMGTDPEWFAKRWDGDVSFTDAEFVAAAQKVADLSAKGYFDMDGLSRSYADTEQAFRDQKAAMYPMGNWFAASADTTPLDFELGVFAMPTDDGRNLAPVVTGPGMSVNSKAKNVDLAKKWALAFQTNKDNVENNIKVDGGLVTEDFKLPSGLGKAYLATNDVYRAAIKDGNTVPASWYVTGAVPTGFTAAIDPAIVDLINGRTTPEDFGAYLDQKWDELSAAQ
jgi:ABC-type glycerol-3-phosphate transport system substrate-binding protein